MANFEFNEVDNKLICTYQYDPGFPFDLSRSDTEEGVLIKRTFFINEDINHKIIDEEILEFQIGELNGDYYKLDRNVFNTENTFYFHKGIILKEKYFIQNNKISVLHIMDNLISEDLYIGGNESNSMPEDVYINMIRNFPNKTELEKYQKMRIEYLCDSYISLVNDNKQNYIDYINKKDKNVTNKELNFNEDIIESELDKYQYILEKLTDMLQESEKYSEEDWQIAIAKILMLLNSNYIGFLEKLKIPIEEEGDFREPDFLLVDADGFIDIIEIKKADHIKVLNRNEYRNNFIPSRELTGSIMQCNKYCFWLMQNRGKNEELISRKFEEKYGMKMNINIRNPRFTVILGRNVGFTEKQKKDFKTIKNQYNNVNEILTYDDIVQKLERIIKTFLVKIK